MSDLEQFEELLEADPEEETPPQEETEPETEEAVEAEAEEPERDERLQSYLDKYGGDVDKALAAAVEAQELIGRQGSELGELRKSIEELSERIPEEEYAPVDQQTVSWLDTLAEERPQQAALWALQNDRSGTLYERVMEQWADASPLQASRFETELRMAQLRSQMEKEARPLQEQAAKSEIGQAWIQAAQEIPDLNEYAQAIVEEARESPEILREADSFEKKVKAYHKLYRMVRGAQASTIEAVQAESEQEQKEQARADKLGGTAPAQQKAVTPGRKSAGDQWLEEIGFEAVLDRHSPVE